MTRGKNPSAEVLNRWQLVTTFATESPSNLPISSQAASPFSVIATMATLKLAAKRG